MCDLALVDLTAAVHNKLAPAHLADCHYHIGLACANRYVTDVSSRILTYAHVHYHIGLACANR